MLLEFAKDIGLTPKRTSSTHGGEYHSSCPRCGGKDRFFIQPSRKMKNCCGYYHCRQCETGGDTIQFCIDFMGLTFHQACEKIGHTPQNLYHSRSSYTKPFFVPACTVLPSEQWQKRAFDFALDSHRYVLNASNIPEDLGQRGFTLATIKKFQLGWNPLNRYDAPNLWGISGDAPRDIWLPQGIVIPSLFDGLVMKLTTRRAHVPPNDQRKYVKVSGGRNSPSFFGELPHRPVIILESELDAILVQQFADDLCACMSIPAGNKPDIWADQILRAAPQLIFSMDFDEPGKNTFAFWKTVYPHIKPWPVPRGKSPGDAYKLKVNLREWIISGIG